MTGLEIIKASTTTAGEIADIISKPCPPVIPETCDRLSCRECWLAWLVTGEPPEEKGPSDEQTAPCGGCPLQGKKRELNGNQNQTAGALDDRRALQEAQYQAGRLRWRVCRERMEARKSDV